MNKALIADLAFYSNTFYWTEISTLTLESLKFPRKELETHSRRHAPHPICIKSTVKNNAATKLKTNYFHSKKLAKINVHNYPILEAGSSCKLYEP